MGRDKSLLPVDGVAMAVRVADALRSAGCRPVVAIGGDAAALSALGLEVVADEHPGEGPLGGVITALHRFPAASGVMVVACDLPLLTAATVSTLLDGRGDADVAMAQTDRLQPLCAVWSPGVVDRLQTVFDTGERRLQAALEGMETRRVGVDHQELANHNTPGDLPH